MKIDNTRNTPFFKASYVIHKKSNGEETKELSYLKTLLKKAKHKRIKSYKATDAFIVTSNHHTIIMDNGLKQIKQKRNISKKKKSKKLSKFILKFIDKCSEFNKDKLIASINKVAKKKQ